jgi:hypothetical protein
LYYFCTLFTLSTIQPCQTQGTLFDLIHFFFMLLDRT